MKNVITIILTMALIFAITYLGTIKEGWYITADDGIETHCYYKNDMFGNRWITGTKSFVLYSR